MTELLFGCIVIIMVWQIIKTIIGILKYNSAKDNPRLRAIAWYDLSVLGKIIIVENTWK